MLRILLTALLTFWLQPIGLLPARDSALVQLRETRADGLPKEASETLKLIKKGGPFPYQRDSAVFGNFEPRLPLKEHGDYREYTVPTPGSNSRGARRIIPGRKGEYYYTADYYKTFRRIKE